VKRHDPSGLGFVATQYSRALAGLQAVNMHAVLYYRRPEQLEALEKSDRPQSYVFIDQIKHYPIMSESKTLNRRLTASSKRCKGFLRQGKGILVLLSSSCSLLLLVYC